MDLYALTKIIHIISSTIFFGTGIGTAFFMLQSWFTPHLQEKFYAVRHTVLADYLFTLPAAILQPLSGIALIYLGGHEWSDLWLILTYCTYIFIILCWIPVVWIQITLKQIVAVCLKNKVSLPQRYHTLFKIWFILGWPAFLGLLFIFYLMVVKPL